MTTYFIGEGLSSLFPSVVSLIQGVGTVKECLNHTNTATNQTKLYPVYNAPRFSIEAYFGFLTFMMAVCSFCYLLLNYLASLDVYKGNNTTNTFSNESKTFTYNGNYEKPTTSTSEEQQALTPHNEDSLNSLRSNTPNDTEITKSEYVFFYFIIFTINCFTNGILPSVSSFTALPYGETAYHISLALGNIANPCGCMVAFYKPIESKKAVGLLSLIGCGKDF